MKLTRIYSSKMMKTMMLTLLAIIAFGTANAQQRRPIDSQHPLWLIHIDVWNHADPQKIIDLIPDDIKPYVCMNLSLSCAYDTQLNIHQRPQNGIRTYKSWASVCQMNNMWFTCQPASGGHTHIHDNDLETFEYFFKNYPNFLGWNFAEQFWGFNDPGDLFSSSDVERIELFANLVPMHHKYGGFLTISFCGNIWSHPLNPIGMMKRNDKLLQACKDYPEAILWLYKYTTSSCFYNNESVCFGPFVAGLAKNYGVRYDNCGWNGALDDMFPHTNGEINEAYRGQRNALKYPVAAGIGTVMEQTCQNGGAVWDGPELIWTEDFQNLGNTTVDGYTQRNWGTFPGFRNIWYDMFRKVIDGTMYIPSQQEIIDKTKIIVVNEVKSGNDEDKYATWNNLYDGLYKLSDPFNKGDGYFMNNYNYMKSSGRYGTIPVTPCMTTLSTSIPTKVKKSTRTSTWPSIAKKVEAFNAAYPEVSTGDMFVSRYKNQLVTYTPYSYFNTKTNSKANIPLQYNTCQSMDLTWGRLCNGIVKEYEDHIDFYLNNYRSDTTKAVNDIIVINGATEKPTYTMTKRQEATASASDAWDAEAGKYTLTISHNGPVDLKVNCKGEATDRKSDYVANTHLETPKQPEDFFGTLIIEAEDMNFRSVKSCQTWPYGDANNYRAVRGHSGNGFIDMGTNTNGGLTKAFKVKKGGDYKVAVRYTNTHKAADIYVRLNDKSQRMACKMTARNEWRKDTITATLNEGDNTVYVFNKFGINMMIDQVILTPADQEVEKFGIKINEAENGTVTADVEEAVEGQTVTLNVEPKEGFSLAGWNVIHGNVTLKEDGNTVTFTMPDDLVTLEPIFVDNSTVYEMDMTDILAGTFPPGWRATDGETIQQYPNSYGSGPRTMSGFTGTYNKAIYWRSTSLDYGKQSNYPLTLEPGKYKLTFAMAAWKGSPTCKAQILTANGSVVQETANFTAAPNANGTASANLSSTTLRTIDFEVKTKGNFVINFQCSGGFLEYLLCSCKINKVIEPTAIEDAFVGEAKGTCEYYDAEGMRIPTLQRGINLIRMKNGDIKKVIVK